MAHNALGAHMPLLLNFNRSLCTLPKLIALEEEMLYMVRLVEGMSLPCAGIFFFDRQKEILSQRQVHGVYLFPWPPATKCPA